MTELLLAFYGDDLTGSTYRLGQPHRFAGPGRIARNLMAWRSH
jgi:hypothetical protein